MKNITLISMLCIFVGLQSCKPRSGSSLSAVPDHVRVDKQLKTLFTYRAIADSVGLHVNNHPFYRRALMYAVEAFSKVTQELKTSSKARANNFKVKMESIKWLSKELTKAEYDEFLLTEFEEEPTSIPGHVVQSPYFKQMDPEGFGPEGLINLAKLDRASAPSCEYLKDPMLANRRFAVCYSFETCGYAVNELKVLSQFTQEDKYRKYVPAVDKLFEELSLDIQCLVDSHTKNLLLYRAETLKLSQRFYKAYEFEPFHRPMPNSSHGESIAQLQGNLRSMIKKAEKEFIRTDDPSRVKMPIIDAMREDQAYKTHFDMDYERYVHDDDRLGNPDNLQCNDEKCESITLKLDDEQQAAIEHIVDDSAGYAAAAYSENRAMLEYIERASTNDIRPWLSNLESKVQDWVQWRVQFETSGTPRPQSLELISPTVAFQMLAIFYEHEAFLPLRRQYLRTMRFVSRKFYRFKDQNSLGYKEKLETASVTIDALGKAIDAYDKSLASYADGIGFAGRNLLNKEVELTTRERGYPEYFHSLMASIAIYAKDHQDYAAAATEVAEINAEQAMLGESRLLDKGTLKKLEQANKKRAAYQKQAISAALELSCLSYGAGEQIHKFYETGINKPIMSCWKWVHKHRNNWFHWLNGDSRDDFKVEDGFVGNFPLERICRPPGSSSPISWTRKIQIDSDAADTAACAETTMKFQQEIKSLAFQAAAMPVMMGAGGIVTQLIIRKMLTARMTSVIASRIGSKVATRLTGSTTSKGVGQAATDAVMLRGKLLSGTQVKRVADLLARRKLAQWSSAKFGKIAMSATSSMISAAFLTVASRTVFTALGMQSLVNPEYANKYGYLLGGIMDWSKETMINAAIFMSFGVFHGLSGTASSALASTLPRSSLTYSFVSNWMPFFGTVGFFSATPKMMEITNHAVKATTGYDLGLHDEDNAHGYYYSLFHSLLITLAFKGGHMIGPRLTTKSAKNWMHKRGIRAVPADVKPLTEAETIAQRAEMMRFNRIFRNPRKLSQSFEMKPTAESKDWPVRRVEMVLKEGNKNLEFGVHDPIVLFGLRSGFEMRTAEANRIHSLKKRLEGKERLNAETRKLFAEHSKSVEKQMLPELTKKWKKYDQRMAAQIKQLRSEKNPDMDQIVITRNLRKIGAKLHEVMKDPSQRIDYLQSINVINYHIYQQSRAQPSYTRPDSSQWQPSIEDRSQQ